MTNCNNFNNLSPREQWLARADFQKYNIVEDADWKTVPGFPEYRISTSSIVLHEKSYGKKPRRIVQTIRNNKYFYVTLTTPDGIRVGFPIDYLMIMTFYDIPKSRIRKVIHRDDVKHNNQLKNLSYILW